AKAKKDTPSSVAFGSKPGAKATPKPTPAHDPDFDDVDDDETDDTPPSGVYAGGEEVQVIDAGALGRALAQANGATQDYAGPKLDELRGGLVGMDLGAAVAVIARFNQDGKHEVVPNEDDELGTPTH